MMKLSELFSELSYGELSNLAMTGEGSGTIQPVFQPKVVLYTNDGLLDLYSQFILKEDDLLLRLSEEITFYHLLPRFAVEYQPVDESDDEAVRYIEDHAQEPFLGDVIKVLRVVDSNGVTLPLNDIENPRSVFTPQPTLLQVINPVAGASLNVEYQTRHEKLSGDLDQYIDLPDVLFPALRVFIAAAVFSHMNTQNSSNKAKEFLVLYKSMCQNAVDKDLVSTSISSSNTRFERRGWV